MKDCLVHTEELILSDSVLKRARSAADKRAADGFKIGGEFVSGAESMQKSVFEKTFGIDVTKTLVTKTKSHGRRLNENYRANSWNDPVAVQTRVVDRLDELMSNDPSLANLMVRPDARILRTGTIVPGGLMRDKNGLRSAYGDDLYLENVKAICLTLMEGVVKKYQTVDGLKKGNVRVSLPLDRGKGMGFSHATDGEFPDCCSGPDANYAMSNIVFQKMIAHPDGLFMYESLNAPIVTGYRCQNPTIVWNDESTPLTKLRYSAHFDSPVSNKLYEGLQWEPADGIFGSRVRLINNVPTVVQLATVVVDKIFMGNIPNRMKPILKRTPEELAIDTIGGTVVDTDFGQFEFTQEEATRTLIAVILFSDRVVNLLKHIDQLDLIGSYIDDFDNVDGSTARNVWWAIRKSGDKKVQEQFDVLLSGIGVTTLYGKVLGCSEIGTNLCRTLDVDAMTFWGYPGKETCLASEIVRNCGDDCRSLAHVVRTNGKFGNYGSFTKWYEGYLDTIVNEKRYVMDIEGVNTAGGSYIGQRAYNADSKSPLDPTHVVEHCHVSHARFISNPLQKESSIDTKFRPLELEWTGLYGTIESAYRSMVVHGGRSEAYWMHNTDIMLDLSGCNADVDTIKWNAEQEALIIEERAGGIDAIIPLLKKKREDISREEMDILSASRGMVVQMLMKHYNMKDPDQLIWDIDRNEIIKDFGETVFSLLFLLVPDKLTGDITRFINVTTFEQVRSDLRK